MKRNFLLSLISLLCLLLFLVQCKDDKEQADQKFSLISDVVSNPENPYSFENTKSRSKSRSLPIGIFDSGTGGLSVLNSILELDEFNNRTGSMGSDGIADFSSERFIFLADEANMPYGKYNAEGRADFLRELVLKDVLFLMGNQYYNLPGDPHPQMDKDAVKSIVIACNTATAYGLETVRTAFDYWDTGIEILGIIDAGSRSAIESLMQKGNKNSVIGILATEGTCASGGYPRTIQKLSADIHPEMEVRTIQQAGIGLAGAIDGDINYVEALAREVREENEYFGPGINHPDYPIDLSLWEAYNFEPGSGLLIEKDGEGKIIAVQINSVENYVRYMITHLAGTVLEQYPKGCLDVVILGCTHYMYVEDEIMAHLEFLRHFNESFRQIIPENIQLIDPASSLAMELYQDLQEKNLLGENDCRSSEFYISVPNPVTAENIIDENGEFPYSWKYGREINTSLEYVRRVPFSDDWIEPGIRMRIRENLPLVYDIIYGN